MKTFQIKDGDLVLGPGGFQTLEGPAKVAQDLGIAVREPIGCDRFHEGWGSGLHAFVGGRADDYTQMLIEGEINRLVNNYMMTQAEHVERDDTNSRKPRFATSELIGDIDSIDIVQQYDRFFIRVSLTTVAGDSVTLVQTVGV
jgi:hypothetical protein